MKKAHILTYLMIVLSSLGMAQNMSINESGAEPDGSAMLDVQSTSLGILIPRMTAAQRAAIVSPANGLMVYQTDGDPGLYIHEGGSLSWYKALDSSDVVSLTQQERSLNDTAGVHLMTKELVTDGNFISGDGDVEGISVDFNGRVNVTGSTPGNTNLTVNGMVRTGGQGYGYEFSNSQIQITGNNGNSGDMRFRTGANDRMIITGAGTVGIGTNAPSAALDVNGTIELSGELHTTSTGTYNMVPIAMASVDSPGTVLNGTGNVTVTNSSAGTYSVTVAGHSANINNDIVQATLTSSNGGMITVNSLSGGYVVYTRNASGVLTNTDFNIIIYAP